MEETPESLEERLKKAEKKLRDFQAIHDARERYSTRGLQVSIRELSKANHALGEAEKRLQQQNQELEELNKIKDQFLAFASHDLRSPLANIKGLAYLLKENLREKGISEEEELIFKIEQTADYTLNLARDLLDHALIQVGIFSITKKLGSLNAVIKNAVNMQTLAASRKGISIQLNCDEQLEDFYFDQLKIEQVLQNLISNGIKFSNRSSNIAIDCQLHQDDIVLLTVEDQGLGIPKEELKDIFNPYQRKSTRPTGSEKSTGLGLSIVKNIVDAHNGEISVFSEPNTGSHFKVVLPYQKELQ